VSQGDTQIAPIAKSAPGEPIAVEGERVFTIGSPLNQRKILTTGIVSKLEERAIISDININPGNSGGPFFNSLGFVIGITTFTEKHASAGPGISGIVRIEQVEDVLATARAKMANTTPPSSKTLPVEPKAAYPLDAIKAAAKDEHFDARPYIFSESDYDLAVITPVLKYNLQNRAEVEAAKEKSKRTRNSQTAVQGTFQPLSELKNWENMLASIRQLFRSARRPNCVRLWGLHFFVA
jgi:S1-C subfamily serine protease